MGRLNGDNVGLQLPIKSLFFITAFFYFVKQELKPNVMFSISPLYAEQCFASDNGCCN